VAGADRGAARSIDAPGPARSLASRRICFLWRAYSRVEPGHAGRVIARKTRAAGVRHFTLLATGRCSNGNVTTVAHPLVQHKLTLMRDKTTDEGVFVSCCARSDLLCYEVIATSSSTVQIETPLMAMQAQVLAGKKLVFRHDPARRKWD